MKRYIYTLILIFVHLSFNSCIDNEGEKLREQLCTPIPPPHPRKKMSKSLIKQYRDIELAYNERYVTELKKILENSFENQLKVFEDRELGFFASYEHMFNYIFWDQQKFEDSWKVKSSKYFNSIDIEIIAQDCCQDYIKDVSLIRGNFHKSQTLLPEIITLELPTQEIYLGGLKTHSRNNLIIEIGVDLLIGLLVLLIVSILSLIVVISIPTGFTSLFITVLSIVASIILSIYNDNKLLDSLREQNTAIMEVDYRSILKNLNENTYKFYGE